MTVLLIVVLVPIIIFGVTHFVSSSLVRYSTQNRNAKAEYLAQAGIHRAIYNLEATGSPGGPNLDWDANNTITLTASVASGGCGSYLLRSKGTSISTSYPTQVSRWAAAIYNPTLNQLSRYVQDTTDGVLNATCCTRDIIWPYEENTGRSTTSNTGLVGQFCNGATCPSATGVAWQAGIVGSYALTMSPSSGNVTYYVRVSDNTTLDLTTAGTVMAWVNFSNVSTNAGIVHKGQATNNSDMAYSLALNNSRRVAFTVASGSSAATRTTLASTTRPPAGTWVHVAGTWGTAGMAVYYNGQLLVSNSTVKIAQNSSGSLQHGVKYPTNNATRCRCSMDDVRIYNCAKTADEIKSYYNSTCTPQPTCQVP